MELCIALAGRIFSLFLMAACGALLAKKRIIGKEECGVLSRLGVYLLCPCLILSGFLPGITQETAAGLAVAFVLAVFAHLAFFLLTFLYRRIRPISGVDAASLIISNAGNIVIPLVSGTVGPAYIIYSTPYLVVQNLFTWTGGICMVSEERKMQPGKIFSNPNLLAILAGFLVTAAGIPIPAAAAEVIEAFGGCMPPLSMLLVGATVAELSPGKLKKMRGIGGIVLGRLVLFPAAVLGFLAVFQCFYSLSDIWKIVFVVMLGAAGPSAALVPQIAEVCHRDTERASGINLVSTLLCIVTLPAMAYLLQIIL